MIEAPTKKSKRPNRKTALRKPIKKTQYQQQKFNTKQRKLSNFLDGLINKTEPEEKPPEVVPDEEDGEPEPGVFMPSKPYRNNDSFED